MKRFKNTYMFISAAKAGYPARPRADSSATSKVQHWPLRPPALRRAQTPRLSLPPRPHLSKAHVRVFERSGYSLGFWVLVKEFSFFFYFLPPLTPLTPRPLPFLTISMPTVKYPLYFRYVLNTLFVFFAFVFLFKKIIKKRQKRIRRLPHVCPALLM